MNKNCLLLSLVLIGVLGSPSSEAISIYVVPDVPTTLGGGTFLPSDIVRYNSGTYSLALGLPLPQGTSIDALHRMDGGDWLLAVDLPGQIGPIVANTRDVIRYNGTTFSLFLCGASIGVPSGTAVDAILVNGGDAGNLVLSFDIPTVIGMNTFEPSDLVELTRTGPLCSDWAVTGLFFDASGAVPPVPLADNVTAAEARPTGTILSFDVPTTLGVTFVPGNFVSWNGAAFTLFEPLATWPISSSVNASSFLPDPGIVPPTIELTRLLPDGSQINIAWSPSCSVGAEDYGIYEGAIGNWYSHASVDCNDELADLNEDIGTTSGNRYYLVVPKNDNDEGSYGTSSSGVEEPVGTIKCVATQVVRPCP